MVDVDDEKGLKHLTWAIYDGALLPGDPPELQGQHDWVWIIAGAYCLVFRGRSNFNHCPCALQHPLMLSRLQGRPCWSMCEDESMCEEDREDADDEDADKESESPGSSGSMQESPHSTCCYSDRHCHPCSWAEWSESGSGEDGSFGELAMSQDSGGKGESEVGCPPALSSCPLCEQESPESPEVAGQAAPGETTPTTGNLLPTGSQDAVVVHAMEDELRNLK